MLEHIPLTYYALSGLLNFITLFTLSIFVFSKNTKLPINRIFSVFTLVASSWGLFHFLWLSTIDKSFIAEFYLRTVMLFVILMPAVSTHFILTFLKIAYEKRINFGNYLISFLIGCTVYTQLFAKDIGSFLVFPYWLKPGPVFHFHLIHFLGNVIYSYFLLLQAFKHQSGIIRNQILYIFIGTVIGYTAGILNYCPWYRLPIPPFLNPLVSVYVAFVSYAIIRHQLMDIEVVIKKTLVFVGMFVFAFGVFVGVTLSVSQLFGVGRIIPLAISALIIIIGLRPIESFLVNATDKFLFQKKYEYKQVLRAFIDEVITLFSLDEIASSTLKLLDQTIHPYSSAVFIYNKLEDKYQLYNAYGFEDKNISFTSGSKLVSFLKKSYNPAVIKQVDGIAGVNPEVQKEMAGLKAVICLPLILHSDLIGFISLGKKKSDEEYTKEDLDVLLDLSRTETVAIANSQLLAEAAQAERRAAIGTMSAGINHEIGNPLNIINTKIQVFRTAVERGFYKGKSKEEIMEECAAILNETIRQTERIAEITKKLSNFAKPGKEFKPELISIPQEIDNTMDIAGHDLELERIKIVKEISAEANEILADKGETQQIFFNIIRNAGQAIDGPGTITIKVFTTPDCKVRIEIKDTGKGIPEDKIHRVFEPFFTTKGPNKGTGLGLSIVRQLVWKNKGEISFRSQEGVGTTFILEFPKAK